VRGVHKKGASGYGSGDAFQLEYIPGFDTDVKKVPGHGFFN